MKKTAITTFKIALKSYQLITQRGSNKELPV